MPRRKELIPLVDRADNLHHRHQVITVGGVTLALFATGNILGFSSFTIPALISSESSIKATQDDLSWIASLVTIGCIVGSLIGGILSDAIGRKKTILIGSLLFAGGWLVIARAKTVGHILIGRMITGVASGSYSSAVQVYICEIAEPSIRGVSGTIPSLMVSIGILAVYCLGSITHWRTAAYICSSFPIIVFTYILFLPESPVWLISRGRTTSALRSLTWLRNDDSEAESECMRLIYLKERRTSRRWKRFTQRSTLKPLGIGMALFFFQQFSGIYPITFYLQFIFQIADNFINDSLETISIGFVRMFVTFLSLFLVGFLNRRLLLITSGILMALANGVLGGYFYLREITVLNYYENNAVNYTGSIPSPFSPLAAEISIKISDVSIEWVPLVCLLVFMLGYCIGFGIIPYFFIAEISSSDVRSWNCSLAYGFCQICLFTSVKIFFDCLNLLSSYGTFWVYSGVAFTGVLFVACFVPETAGLNSSEIEAIFESGIHLGNCSSNCGGCGGGFGSGGGGKRVGQGRKAGPGAGYAGPSSSSSYGSRRPMTQQQETSLGGDEGRHGGEDDEDDEDFSRPRAHPEDSDLEFE